MFRVTVYLSSNQSLFLFLPFAKQALKMEEGAGAAAPTLPGPLRC